MPGKKKKYNSRFPPARIKKIMQSDEEVGKVAAAVPVIISRALELFVQSLLSRAGEITMSRHARTLTPSHLKQCVLAEQRFDFLQEVFASVSTVGADGDSEAEPVTPLLIQEKISFPSTNNPEPMEKSSVESSVKVKGRGRGRPRKIDSNNGISKVTKGIKRPRGRPKKSSTVSLKIPVDEESNDELEVDLKSSDDTDVSEEETNEEFKVKKPLISTKDSVSVVVPESSSLPVSTKKLSNKLLGDIQITIPQVSTDVFGSKNSSSCVSMTTNGTSGIPVPVITSVGDSSKPKPNVSTVISQVDEDYDC